MSVKGEKYTSKKSMMKHEKTEPMSMKMKEYGSKKVMKKTVKKTAKKSARRGMFGSK